LVISAIDYLDCVYFLLRREPDVLQKSLSLTPPSTAADMNDNDVSNENESFNDIGNDGNNNSNDIGNENRNNGEAGNGNDTDIDNNDGGGGNDNGNGDDDTKTKNETDVVIDSQNIVEVCPSDL
jgi:hypothetical protein